MLVGPIFTREAVVTPRRARLYLVRSAYVGGLFVLMCTAWLLLAGTQVVRNLGDLAQFGSKLFQILALLQLALVVFFSALMAAGAVAQEKDRRTLILLLMTRLNNSELVLGKLFASLLFVGTLLFAALPVFMLTVLFGGISFSQVLRVFAVTAATALLSGSLGAVVAFWREKTFQTLAITALALIAWFGVGEAMNLGVFGQNLAGLSAEFWGQAISPRHAIQAAALPVFHAASEPFAQQDGVWLYVLLTLLVAGILNLTAVLRVRIWNPSREARPKQDDEDEAPTTIWSAEHDPKGTGAQPTQAEQDRAGHVDSRLRSADGKAARTREVWDNPVLWREIRTWAYGRKVFFIRATYVVVFAAIAVVVHQIAQEEAAAEAVDETVTHFPALAWPLAPFLLLSLVMVNAVAVTAVTSERDGRALDLLLATDITPKEFLFGKLGGVSSVAGLMLLLPIALVLYVAWVGAVTPLETFYLAVGLITLEVFVAMLGVHCGMIYADSRTAILASLGAVFFLFLGVVTCILMMISFNAFEVQLPPFLAFIVGGWVGLYVTLGARNPSPALGVASALLPAVTFYASVSFLLDKSLQVFVSTVAAYGFTTAAMMIPALGEFDIAMGRAAPPPAISFVVSAWDIIDSQQRDFVDNGEIICEMDEFLNREYLSVIQQFPDEEVRDSLLRESAITRVCVADPSKKPPSAPVSDIVPEEFEFLAGSLCDLGFDKLSIPPNEVDRIYRAFCSRGVAAPGTPFKLRHSVMSLFTLVEPRSGNEVSLPDNWLQTARSRAWIGKKVAPADLDLSLYEYQGDGFLLRDARDT